MHETHSPIAGSIRPGIAILREVTPSCLVVLFALGCGAGARPVIVTPIAAPTAPVAPAEPTSKPVAERASEPIARPSSPRVLLDRGEITATGVLAPLVTIEVPSPSSGKIASVTVDAGTLVKKGQVLAQLDTGKTAIRAPIDGIILSRHIEAGQTVILGADGSSPSLFTIASDLSKLAIELRVDPHEAPQLAIGMKATFTVDAYPAAIFQGIVRQIRVGTIAGEVVLDTDNADQKLRPGMTVSVTFPRQP